MSMTMKQDSENSFISYMHKVINGAKLAPEDAVRVYQIIRYGGATPGQIAALLTALKCQNTSLDALLDSAASTAHHNITEVTGELETHHPLNAFTKQIIAEEKLSEAESAEAFSVIMQGEATPAQMAAFLVALKIRGETIEEIAGAASVLREKADGFQGIDGMMDTCGTGGDAKGTFNISTATAIVLAACGVPVVKHGNRAVSSKAGSADILSELGIKVDAPIPVLEKSLRDVGMCFLFAPEFHKAMKYVAPVRQELGVRTIFNLLGPLANPARPKRQLLGVYDKKWLRPMAKALHKLGAEKAWVVCGSDGMDELSLCGPSHVCALDSGTFKEFTINPEDAGLETVPPQALQGGNAEQNAQALRSMLLGEKGAFRDAVLLNSAGGLVIAGKAENLKEGAAMTASKIDDGSAYKLLQTLIDASHERA